MNTKMFVNEEHTTLKEFMLDKENFKKLSYEMVFSGEPETENSRQDHSRGVEELEQLLKQQEQEFEEKLKIERESARQQGYKQGFDEGYQTAEEELEKSLAPLQKSIDESKKAISEITNGIKPYMAELVFELAENVLRQPVNNKKLRNDTEAELSRILEEIQGQLKIKIEISPADYIMVEELVKAYRKESEIEIRKKDSLNPGEYRVSTNKEFVIKEFRKILRDFKDHVAITNNEEDS